MEVKQEYENGEYEKIENASSTYASCECKTEPDWAGYETADDEMRGERLQVGKRRRRIARHPTARLARIQNGNQARACA